MRFSKWKEYINIFDNIDALLIALVLNVNVLRIILGVSDTNLLLYLMYVLTVFVIYIKYHKKAVSIIKKMKWVKLTFLFIVAIVFYSMISLLWSNYDSAFMTFCKFVVALVLAFLCVLEPSDKIKAIGIYFVSLNIFFSILCLINIDRVTSMFGDGMNYLNATLTLGFSFRIALVSLFSAFFNKQIASILFWAILSALFFISLLGFIARGVLIFPPLIALCMIPFMGRQQVGKTIIILGIAVCIGFFAFQYFLDFASDFGASRMLNLFENPEEQDRVELWQDCSTIMIDNFWFLFGGGICAFSSAIYYPHNIFLQILGEYGMIPFIIFIYMLVSLFKKFFRLNKVIKAEYKWSLFFVIVGMIYYTMTFSKSFSLYDALPLFIMMALMYGYFIDCYLITRENETEISRVL